MNYAAIGSGIMSGVLSIVAGWFYFRHKKDSKLTIILFGLVGMLGVGSLWAGIAAAVHNTEMGIAHGLGGALGGASAGIVIGISVIACLEIFWKALHRSGQPKKWHPWVALILGIVMSASGVGLFTSFKDTVTSIATQVGQDTMGAGGSGQ
jgi:dipeptide/tripeptide permease